MSEVEASMDFTIEEYWRLVADRGGAGAVSASIQAASF